MNMSVKEYEHIAIMVDFPNEKFTMCIIDMRNEDTDLIRYRPVEAKFYIPTQYLVPRTRANMAQRQNADRKISNNLQRELSKISNRAANE